MSFPQYADYKDSGVEWLGEVPGHWDVFPLKRDLAFLTSGSRGWAEHYSDDGALFIRIGNLTRDGIHLDLSDIQRVEVPDGAEGERTRVVGGDVLFSITAYLGSVAVAPEELEVAYVSQHVALARLHQRRFIPAWVGYVTLSNIGETYLGTQGYGGTKVQLSLDDVANLIMTAPPLPEQSAIAAFLDRQTGKIDALVAEQERLLTLLAEKRQAVISHAVTKGLNPAAPMKDSGIEWLGEVPEHWKVIPLRWFCTCKSGDSISADGVEAECDEDRTAPVIGGNGVMGYTYAPNITHPVLVIGRVGALCGNVHSIKLPAWVTDNALILDIAEGVFNQEYLSHLLRSRNLNEIASKTAQPLITGSQVRDQRIPLAPMDEQSAIVEFLNEQTAKIDTLTAEALRAIALLKEHRSALISAAVTGKIDVRGLVEAEAA
ncbi:restriction endonuclease subunit S [Magnetospirillum gryphiswaldense]|uniref:Type I restriction-modification system, S subunit n=1 Tax=Magnetospirillum gryphiswaldense TaxID=55518 RepID=A4U327_9PROT|nr:restriction endonuclease subunit S [Magnetospirillum gryphiswaldense]AVM75804.1 EcoKI restriction-modification system protein HsdS [Magnetospirillum gryphiswaldense MSR-1]AVM79707.1 EcoKI restriction-modification system protein HsdS [Magnetospirillum gryphiswaldense]CAM77284.1 type I restriction-modification system, S subunit [Magnetospirillum gryphiswaldense MSR-1]